MKKEESVVVNKEPKRTSKWLIAVIVVIATLFTILPIIGMVYIAFEFDDYIYTEFEQDKLGRIFIKEDIMINNVEGFYNDEEKAYYVQGYLENNSENDLEFIYIEYYVYDENDVLLGTATASVDTLKANTKWKFKAIYSDIDGSEINKFELSKVEFY